MNTDDRALADLKRAFTFAFARGFQIAEETSRSCLPALDEAWAEYAALQSPPPVVSGEAIDRPAILVAARAWWQRKMPDTVFRSAQIKGDGRVDVHWHDKDESGSYTLPVDFMSLPASTPPVVEEGRREAAQQLQDHMEQFHGVCLSASEWDAAILALTPVEGVGMRLDARQIAAINDAAEFLDACAGMDLEIDGNTAISLVEELQDAFFNEDQHDCFHLEVRQALAALSTPVAAQGDDDTKLLDALRDESWDLRCFDIPTGGGDADIGWRVVGHYQADPEERVVSEEYRDDPRAAIRAALATLGAPHEG